MKFQTQSLKMFQKRMRILFRFGNNLQLILRYVEDNERCEVVKFQVLTLSIDTAFPI